MTPLVPKALTNLKHYISLIIQGCSMVQQSIWPRNQTSNKKFYFNEFVAYVLQYVIGIVIVDFRGHGGCQRPKTPLGGQNYHEGVNLLKKIFNESFSAPSKTPWADPIRFGLHRPGRKIHEQTPRSLYKTLLMQLLLLDQTYRFVDIRSKL